MTNWSPVTSVTTFWGISCHLGHLLSSGASLVVGSSHCQLRTHLDVSLPVKDKECGPHCQLRTPLSTSLPFEDAGGPTCSGKACAHLTFLRKASSKKEQQRYHTPDDPKGVGGLIMCFCLISPRTYSAGRAIESVCVGVDMDTRDFIISYTLQFYYSCITKHNLCLVFLRFAMFF